MNKNKLVAGIFFAILGVLLTLEQLDVFDAGRVLRYWPVVLIVFGLMNLGDAGRRGLATVGIIIGSLLVAVRASMLRFSIFDLWPLLLIAVGGVIILRALGISGPDQRTNLWSVLNTRKVNIDPQDLNRRQIIAFMGGVHANVNDVPHEGPVTIEVLSMWGGVEIRVPTGWEVIAEVVPIMGGIDIKTSGEPNGRQLIVRGLVLMAGMEIRNVRTS
jgi:predicted membrane protein